MNCDNCITIKYVNWYEKARRNQTLAITLLEKFSRELKEMKKTRVWISSLSIFIQLANLPQIIETWMYISMSVNNIVLLCFKTSFDFRY